MAILRVFNYNDGECVIEMDYAEPQLYVTAVRAILTAANRLWVCLKNGWIQGKLSAEGDFIKTRRRE